MRAIAILFVVALLLGLVTIGSKLQAQATFTVNTTTDAKDANPGDGVCATAAGQCSLRAAIEEADALGGADTVSVPAGTYTLTTEVPLIIFGDLTLTGAGQGSTIIQGVESLVTTNSEHGVFVTGLIPKATSSPASTKPESTEGGRRVSVLKQQEGAPVLLG